MAMTQIDLICTTPMLGAIFFYLTSDRIYAVRKEQQYKPMKMMTIDETPNEI
jgi:hypothetical protein